MTINKAFAPANGTYNGWTNKETYMLVSRMDNDPELRRVLREICTPAPGLPQREVPMAKQDAKFHLREYIERIWTNTRSDVLGITEPQIAIMSDLVNEALDQVNFAEIIQCHWGKD